MLLCSSPGITTISVCLDIDNIDIGTREIVSLQNIGLFCMSLLQKRPIFFYT